MSLIKLPQIQNGARLAHANTKKYNVQKFSMADTATTEFIITNKPDDTEYTQIYDTNDGMAQIEINHNMYYQDEDFTFDKSSGKIVWTNTAANKGFDLTKDLCDSIRIFYAYTYEKPKMQIGTKFIFNKNDNMGPIGLTIDGTTYTLNGCNKYQNNDGGYSKLFDMEYFSTTLMEMFIKYDSTVTPAIDKTLFDSNGLLTTFFKNHKMKLTRENDGTGFIWSSNKCMDNNSDDNAELIWSYGAASPLPSSSRSWEELAADFCTAYYKGENIVIEFIEE